MGIIRQISSSDIWHLGFKMIYYSIFHHIDYSKSFLNFNGSEIEASVLIGKRSLNDYFNNNIPKDRADFWVLESFEILSIKSSNNSSIEDIMDKVCDKMELGEILWAKPTVDISRNSLARINFFEDEKYHIWLFQKGTF